MIKFARIDGRLIHGQVLSGYVRQYGIDLIIVANDYLANSTFEQGLMKMVAPPGVEIEMLTIDETPKQITSGKWDSNNILLLIKSPIDLVRLLEKEPLIEKVNVGGVHNEGADFKITNEVSATEEELPAWKKLNEMGIKLELQWDKEKSIKDFNKVISKI